MSDRFIPIPDTEAAFLRAAHAANDTDAVFGILDALVPGEVQRFHLVVVKNKKTNEEKLYLIAHHDDDPSEAWKG